MEENEENVHPEYAALPECIKCAYTATEYAWLPEEEKQNLIENECMPDCEED